jgi:hypothetical protein
MEEAAVSDRIAIAAGILPCEPGEYAFPPGRHSKSGLCARRTTTVLAVYAAVTLFADGPQQAAAA